MLVSSQSDIYFPLRVGLPQKFSQAVGCLAVDRLVMFAKGSGIGTVEITDSELVGGRRAHGGQSYFHVVRLLSSPLANDLDRSMMGSLNTVSSHSFATVMLPCGFWGSDTLF